MGNLADELADAFSDSGEEDGDAYVGSPSAERDGFDQADEFIQANKRGVDRNSPVIPDGNLSPPSPRRKSHRRNESAYDGSEYGSESDLDASGVPPSLVAKIDAIESLARRGTESYGGPDDDVVKRVTTGLRDLGSQSSVEGSASRSVLTISMLYDKGLTKI